MKIKNLFLVALATSVFTAAVSSTALASDCGMSSLSVAENAQLTEGKQVLRTDFSQGITQFKIQQLALVSNSSLFSATANFWDITAFGGIGLIDTLKVSDGYVKSDNPIHYDVTPLEGNPFGHLYQPTTYEVTIHRDAKSYQSTIHYLTSPGLVLGLTTQVCLTKVGTKVLFNYDTTFYGNPALGFDTPGFGVKERVGLWMKLFNDDIGRIVSDTTHERLENFEKALLGNKD